MSEIVYTLPRFQDIFINSNKPIVSIIGAKGSSKTWSGTKFALKNAIEKPREQGLIMFNTLQQGRDVFKQDIKPDLDALNWDYHFNEQQMVLKIFGDTIIHIRSAEPDAVKKIESIVYGWGWADEVSFYPPDSLKTFTSRVRKGEALMRITSMPDEPDAFFYGFIERLTEELQGEMFEISLKDNPDRAFAESYEKRLRAMYHGEELKRFLDGARVSLSGQGAFIARPHHRIECPYDPDEEMWVVWDFNADFRAVSCWQKQGKDPATMHDVIGCVKSFKLTHDVINEDAEFLCEYFATHKNIIYLDGDASGDSRSAQTSETMWQTVRRIFRKNFDKKVRYIVRSKNPNVKDTIQCSNWALKNNLVRFDPDEKYTYQSMSQVKLDKFGDLDKSIDYNEKTHTKTHHADTGRYLLYRMFEYVYDGRKGQRVYVL